MKMLTDFAPVGMKLKNYFLSYVLTLGIPLLLSLMYFSSIGEEADWQRRMYDINDILVEAPYFAKFVDGLGVFYMIPLLMAVADCIVFLAYHHYPTHSVYVMKRLPKEREYYKRLYALPLLRVLLSLTLFAMVLWLYYSYYTRAFLPETLPEGQWAMFCEYFFQAYPEGEAVTVLYHGAEGNMRSDWGAWGYIR